MNYEAWTWKAIEGRIIEMADTLRLTPAVSGPSNFVSLMPEVVREQSDAYGYSTAGYSRRASPGALDRMVEVWGWVNTYLDEADRKLIYAWSWVKVRKGMKIGRFAYENEVDDRNLRRRIQKCCQQIANNLNQIVFVRLNSEDCGVSENQPESDQSDVTSNNCGTVLKNGIAAFMSPDARPILDTSSPELAALNQRLDEANQRREREARRREKLQLAA
jgi:hypothetical protein